MTVFGERWGDEKCNVNIVRETLTGCQGKCDCCVLHPNNTEFLTINLGSVKRVAEVHVTICCRDYELPKLIHHAFKDKCGYQWKDPMGVQQCLFWEQHVNKKYLEHPTTPDVLLSGISDPTDSFTRLHLRDNVSSHFI